MTVPIEIAESLVAKGLARDGSHLRFVPLTGGVSSDIWKVSGADRPLCVKRARDRLAVDAVWEVPIERNHYEAEFLRVVSAEVPGFAPDLLAEVEAEGLIVLPFLDSAEWTLWKPQLLAGSVDIGVARCVGGHLGRLISATRERPDLAKRFDTGALFEAIRLDPYLRECARRHPELAVRLNALADTTAARRETLVHGDVSPKNIMVSENEAPVILDAECAWYGDPAFDLAFVLNHLLLKGVVRPDAADALARAISALIEGHARAATEDQSGPVLERATALLPGLLLARVDGKSPVEYLSGEAMKDRVRATARRFLLTPADHPLEIAEILNRNPHR
ncbi:MAG: phosphotransferase [Roseitalea sp.]|jgi:5-methylthioribose kinase|nr:phosphotransferase [Roseitalea sp.]MBO6721810.1 phosphotransferase [Roseitalea sp.]MBO6744876.1 phosphotransferase [Roseitalea sp.]